MGHEDKRQELVEIATRVFLRYGYRKTTLDDIAEAAGLQKSSLYHYFDNKDDLFRETVSDIHNQLIERFEQELTGKNGLLHELNGYIESIKSEIRRLQPNIEFMLEDIEEVLPKTRDLTDKMHTRMNAMLVRRLEKAIEDGELRPCPVKDLAVIVNMFLERVLKACEMSDHHAKAADDAMHYVEVLFKPYFTDSTIPRETSAS